MTWSEIDIFSTLSLHFVLGSRPRGWGDGRRGGRAPSPPPVAAVAANAFAFAALTAEGRVVAWGEETLGGDTHFPLPAARRLRQGVVAIQATQARPFGV